jgi:hypothetical protein
MEKTMKLTTQVNQSIVLAVVLLLVVWSADADANCGGDPFLRKIYHGSPSQPSRRTTVYVAPSRTTTAERKETVVGVTTAREELPDKNQKRVTYVGGVVTRTESPPERTRRDNDHNHEEDQSEHHENESTAWMWITLGIAVVVVPIGIGLYLEIKGN